MMRASVVILAHAEDPVPLRVQAALQQDGVDAYVVSDRDLVVAKRWCHRLSSDGAVSTQLTLADSSPVNFDDIGVVWNCLREVRATHFAFPRESDVRYAVMETQALWLSWLASMPVPVLNRPTPRALGGGVLGDAEWISLARAAGLPTRKWQLSTDARRFAHPQYAPQPPFEGGDEEETHGSRPFGRSPALFLEPVDPTISVATVVCDTVVGEPADLWHRELVALGKSARLDIMQVSFAICAGGARSDRRDSRVCGFSSDLRVAGDDVIETVAGLLERTASSLETACRA